MNIVDFKSRLQGVRQEKSNQWIARCPGHDDATASLGVSIGDKGGILLHCFAGCTLDQILRPMGLTPKDLFNGNGNDHIPSAPTSKARAPRVYPTLEAAVAAALASTHRYHPDAVVNHVYVWSDTWRRVRLQWPDGKEFKEVSRRGTGWVLQKPKELTPLYRIAELPAGGTIYVCEGEKACDAGWKIGLPCVTSGNWSSARGADWSPLAGREVVVLPDNDESGEKYIAPVTDALHHLELPATVRVVRLPDLPEKGDIYDFIENNLGNTDEIRAEIEALVAVAQPVSVPAETPKVEPTEQTTAATEIHFTDLGNAERLVNDHGADLRYTDSHGWLAWTGTYWEADQTAEVERRAAATVRSMFASAVKIEDRDARHVQLEFAMKCEARRRIVDMVALAQAHERIRIRADALDKDKWLLNVQNGTVDLRTGELRPHSRDDLITRCCPVTYVPDAEAPRWRTFLNEIMAGDAEVIEFLRRAVGHSLTGDTRERALFLLFGGGKNGKSTFLHVVRTMLGPYAVHARSETILVRRGDNIPCDLARLRGARFVTITETEEGRRLDIARMKELTGGCDPVTARFLHQNEFTYLPEFKPWIATNHRPVVNDDSDATWDRIYSIPFRVRIPDDKIDKALPAKLIGELPGVLAWAVTGCLDWQASDGLAPPEQVRAAGQEYRTEMDRFAQWRDECCTTGLMIDSRAGELWDSYRGWCDHQHVPCGTQTGFGRRLVTEGFQKTKGHIVTYHGIGLVTGRQETDGTR